MKNECCQKVAVFFMKNVIKGPFDLGFQNVICSISALGLPSNNIVAKICGQFEPIPQNYVLLQL